MQKRKSQTGKELIEEGTHRFLPAWSRLTELANGRRRAGVSPAHAPPIKIPVTRPEYDATIEQLICPYCGLDCGGWCELGDRYRDEA